MQSKPIHFVKQQDASDCAVACLLSVIKYYKGSSTLEKLRKLSGTGTTGTTLLGLYQCANLIGFDAEGIETDVPHLKSFNLPCILHVSIEGSLHYIVCYGYYQEGVAQKSGYFLIGDPAIGIIKMNEVELDRIWKSQVLLKLKPNSLFILKTHQDNQKLVWFRQLIREDIGVLTVTMILGVLVTVMNLATAVFLQNMIDNILPRGSKYELATTLVLLFIILLFRASIGFVRQHYLLLQGKNFNNRIVNSFFSSLIHLPKSFFDTRKTGDMIARMNDATRIQRNTAYISGSVFIDSIIVVATTIFLINYSLTIALVTFCFVPIITFTVLGYSKPIKKKQAAVMSATAVNESNYIDIISGIMVIKAHHQEVVFTQKIKNVYGKMQEQVFALGKLGNRFAVTTDFISIILSIILITISSFMVLNKHLKIGEMMAIISLTGSLIPAVARLSQINLQLQEAKVAFERMFDFTSIKEEFGEQEVTPIIFEKLELKNISFRFAGRKAILNDVSFELSKGEIIALLGESGSGKSTTMAILERFYDVDAGEILLNGIPLKNIYIPNWRNIVASVPQEIKLFNGTIIDNIAFENVADEALKVVDFCIKKGFNKYFDMLPQGYFTLVGEEGINLSGGQKQLIAMARALYREPQVLLLDEATAALDRNTEQFILSLLNQLKSEMAVVLITHRIQTAKISDRIYIIEDGKIGTKGTPKQLLETDNFFSRAIADTMI